MTTPTCPNCDAPTSAQTKEVKTTFKPRPKIFLLLRGLAFLFLALWAYLFLVDRSSAMEAIVIVPVGLVLLFISFTHLTQPRER